MRKTTSVFIAAAFLMITCHCCAQQSSDDLVSRFFQLYKAQGSDSAMQFIFHTTPYVDSSSDDINNLRALLRKTIRQEGTYRGYDLLTKKFAGPDVVIFVLLAKYDREPLTFRITLYRPVDKWQILTFTFNDKISDELEDASKAVFFSGNLPN
jgi:hypothetical protein